MVETNLFAANGVDFAANARVYCVLGLTLPQDVMDRACLQLVSLKIFRIQLRGA
jgi:hypothetical protein